MHLPTHSHISYSIFKEFVISFSLFYQRRNDDECYLGFLKIKKTTKIWVLNSWNNDSFKSLVSQRESDSGGQRRWRLIWQSLELERLDEGGGRQVESLLG